MFLLKNYFSPTGAALGSDASFLIMADVDVFRSVWSSQTISISTKIIKYITAQRVCLKINASLFDESANTGSLAALANICSRKHLDHLSCQTEFHICKLKHDAIVK